MAVIAVFLGLSGTLRADMMADSPVKFPAKGALPAKYPPDRSSKTNEATEKDYYIRSAKVHPHLFYRDVVHANEYGELILAKIMMAFWTGEKAGASPVEPIPLGSPVQLQARPRHGP